MAGGPGLRTDPRPVQTGNGGHSAPPGARGTHSQESSQAGKSVFPISRQLAFEIFE